MRPRLLFLAIAIVAGASTARAEDRHAAALATARLGERVTYTGLVFADAACQKAFGRTGTVAARDAERFRACLHDWLLRTDDPFAWERGGAHETTSAFVLSNAHTSVRIELVHHEKAVDAHGHVAIDDERLVAVAAYDIAAAKGHVLHALPPDAVHVPADEATSNAMHAAKIAHASATLLVCVDKEGQIWWCGVEGASTPREYAAEVNRRACTMGKIGVFAPDRVPVDICALLTVTSP